MDRGGRIEEPGVAPFEVEVPRAAVGGARQVVEEKLPLRLRHDVLRRIDAEVHPDRFELIEGAGVREVLDEERHATESEEGVGDRRSPRDRTGNR